MYDLLKYFLTLLLITLLPVAAWGQQADYIHDSQFPFIIITGEGVKTAPEIPEQEFFDTSSEVLFKVNRTELKSDNAFLQYYRQHVLPRINGKHYQLRKMYIRGAASPEGPYANNQRLSRERSAALVRELTAGIENQQGYKTDVNSVTEDYGYLCLLMQKAGDKDYKTVKLIYDQCRGNDLQTKENLLYAQNGKLWKRLLREYFPQLRAARVILWFAAPEPLPTFDHPKEIAGPPTYNNYRRLPLITTETGDWTRRHLIAVRTNLLHDFFYMPNVGFSPSPNIQLEYYPLDGHYTYNIGLTWGTHRNWDEHKFFQMRDVQLEVRRYFQGGGRFMGAYAGAFLEGNAYGIGFSKEKGWEGEGAGAGLSIGYVLPLNQAKNLRLEFMLAAGFYYTKYDPYVYGNPINGREDGLYYYDYTGSARAFKERNHYTTWLGPTNVGVQLTYDIIYRKRQPVKKGGNL